MACKLGLDHPEQFHYLNVVKDVSKFHQFKCIKYLSLIENGASPTDMPSDFISWLTSLDKDNQQRFYIKVYELGGFHGEMNDE